MGPEYARAIGQIASRKRTNQRLAIDREGKYMAVAAADKTLKIWDIRKFKEVDNYYSQTPASSLDISDTGLLSVGWGPHVTIWKDILKANTNLSHT